MPARTDIGQGVAASIACALTEIALDGAYGVYAVFDRERGDCVACVPSPPLQLKDEQVYVMCPSVPVTSTQITAALLEAERDSSQRLELQVDA